MKKYFFGVMLIIIGSILHSITLKEAYDSAPSQAGYDKYLELEWSDQGVKKMMMLK